jgi:hypothetical protein
METCSSYIYKRRIVLNPPDISVHLFQLPVRLPRTSSLLLPSQGDEHLVDLAVQIRTRSTLVLQLFDRQRWKEIPVSRMLVNIRSVVANRLTSLIVMS